jgi:hypothetical protein
MGYVMGFETDYFAAYSRDVDTGDEFSEPLKNTLPKAQEIVRICLSQISPPVSMLVLPLYDNG